MQAQTKVFIMFSKINQEFKNVKKLDFNAKATEMENKIPIISGLTTTFALTSVKNEIVNISSLVKKQQIVTKKIVKLSKYLLITVMTNILLLQNLIS